MQFSTLIVLPQCTDLLLQLLFSPVTQKQVLVFDLAPGLAPQVQQDLSKLFRGWQWALRCSPGGEGKQGGGES